MRSDKTEDLLGFFEKMHQMLGDLVNEKNLFFDHGLNEQAKKVWDSEFALNFDAWKKDLELLRRSDNLWEYSLSLSYQYLIFSFQENYIKRF